MCLPPACFETGFGFVSGFDGGYCIRQHTLIVRQIRPFVENEERFRKIGHGGTTQNSIPRGTTVTDF